MILLLDSSVLIDALRDKHGRRALLAELVEAGHTLATSAMCLGEVYAGMRPAEETRTETFLASLTCYSITPGIGRRGGSLKSKYARQGKTLGLADTIIAATALEHGLVLMTDNRKDFPFPELAFVDLPAS